MRRLRSCASDQVCGVSKALGCSAHRYGNASSSPFVWIGREKVQSLLRWAGPFSQIQARQADSRAGYEAVKAFTSPGVI